jgi:hypothetical protein
MATGAIIAVAAISAVSALSQGQAAKEQGDFQATVAEQQAARERAIAAAEASDFKRQQARFFGERRAGLGASGIDPGTGSPLNVARDFAAEVELQAARIREGGALRASRQQQEAVLRRRAGENAQRQGFFRAGSSLLQGFGTSFGRTGSFGSTAPTSGFMRGNLPPRGHGAGNPGR